MDAKNWTEAETGSGMARRVLPANTARNPLGSTVTSGISADTNAEIAHAQKFAAQEAGFFVDLYVRLIELAGERKIGKPGGEICRAAAGNQSLDRSRPTALWLNPASPPATRNRRFPPIAGCFRSVRPDPAETYFQLARLLVMSMAEGAEMRRSARYCARWKRAPRFRDAQRLLREI